MSETVIVNKQYEVLARHNISGHRTGERFWAGYPADQEARLLGGGYLRLVVEPTRVKKKAEAQLEEPPPEVANEWLEGAEQ